MKRINIMTSSDDNLAPYITVQIASIAEQLKEHQVSFYLFHYRISQENLKLLSEFAGRFDNVEFSEVIIEDPQPYIELANPRGKADSAAGGWPCEAYFSLCCHHNLPEDVDRVLYIDAGDVIFNGSIDEFYFEDFEGKSLLAAYPRIWKEDGSLPFERDDLSNPEYVKKIMQGGVMNSGSYLINTAKLREESVTMADFLCLADVLKENIPLEEKLWFGDQGFISLAFVGDIKYYELNEHIHNGFYMPYNFGMWCCTVDVQYQPKIIHYADINGYLKPWKARFEKWNPLLPEVFPYKCINEKHYMWHELWWKYCEMTPIYERTNADAHTAAQPWEDAARAKLNKLAMQKLISAKSGHKRKKRRK